MPAQSVTPAVDAGQYVQINPSALSAGGNALSLTGVILTASNRIPSNTVLAFPNDNGLSVANYFDNTSQEYALAQIYFLGFNTSTAKPGQLLYYQYAWQQPTSAWLRGASISSLTISQLQALSGTLAVVIDGVNHSASISLSGATSFSNAAQIIQVALGIQGVAEGSYIGQIVGGTLTVTTVNYGSETASFVGSISGGTMTVSSINFGTLAASNIVQGSGVTVGTVITSAAICGGVGTYNVSPNQTVGTLTLTTYNANGGLQVGTILNGTGITGSTYISTFISGAGGLGTYGVSTIQNAISQTFTANAPAVIYDQVSGAIIIYSGTTGTGSTLSYGSGALATSLNLTQVNGAVISQGTVQGVPATVLNNLIAITKNWASFMTTFEPCPNDKVAFSSWTNGQNNRFHYAMWDTNVANTQAGGPSSSVSTIQTNDYSGTSLIYSNPNVDTIGGEVAAFVMGYAASINFNVPQGRATAAFKSQSGLAPEVFSTVIRNYIVTQYGMNCYVDATTADQAFTFYDNGSVSGPFLWLDAYVDQIWLNAQLQLAFMVLLTTVNSIPYNQNGYAMIAETASTPIAQALLAGVIQPGVPLSGSQIAFISALTNNVNAYQVVQTQGWYLQITAAPPTVRQARQSPGISLVYTDGGSVQQIVMASIDAL